MTAVRDDSDNRLLQAALHYASRGWGVVPLHCPGVPRCSCGDPECVSPAKHPRTGHGLKDASTDEATIRSWWVRWPDANVGIVTGEVSGIVVLDVDPRHGGDETLAALEADHGDLPATVRAATGGGGWHWFFAHPAERVRNTAGKKLGPGLDVRGDGGYVVASPSRHSSGRTYVLMDHGLAPAPMPPWMLDRLREPVRRERPALVPVPRLASSGSPYGLEALAQEVAKVASAPEGQRNLTLNDAGFLLGQLVGGGELEAGVVESELRAAAMSSGLGHTEITATLGSAIPAGEAQPRSAPEPPPPPALRRLPEDEDDGATRHNLTDLGNAERLIEAHGADLLHVHPWGRWLAWDGARWAIDDVAEVVRRAKSTVRAILTEAVEAAERDERKALTAWALRSEAEARIRAMVSLASSEPGIPVLPDDLDADPWRLTVDNGTLDLRTGVLGPHDRGHRITKRAPVRFDVEADCPGWRAFLERIMGGDAELISFLQRAVGYSLTGSTREQVLFILHGSGANGKSTFIEVLRRLLGDYAQQMPTDTLLDRRDSGIPNDVARLRGARFISAVESDEGRRLAESLVKQLTGGDTITARFMRAEFFEFRPVGKIWLATNHKPVVRGTDDAVWRRIRLVPFAVTIPEDERDKGLGDALAEELPGILRWAVSGCLAWQRRGLTPPGVVREATETYRAEMDVLAGFVDERCSETPGAWVAASELYETYRAWADSAGERPWSQKFFGARLAERGYERVKRGKSNRWHWVGIGLRSVGEEANPSENRTNQIPAGQML